MLAELDGAEAALAAAAIVEEGGIASSLEQDVSREGDWQDLFADMLARHDRIDACVDNAGMYCAQYIYDTPVSMLDELNTSLFMTSQVALYITGAELVVNAVLTIA